jgi:hypothetical protein
MSAQRAPRRSLPIFVSSVVTLALIFGGLGVVEEIAVGVGQAESSGLNDTYYWQAESHPSAVRLNGTTGPVGNGTNPDTSGGWFYSANVNSSFSTTTSALYYNITPPESFDLGDALFAGLSVYSSETATQSYDSFDQMGIVGGGTSGTYWDATQTSTPCYDTRDWCAWFSICINECSSGDYLTWEFGILTPGQDYEMEMYWTYGGIARCGGYGILNGDLYWIGPNNVHQLQDSMSYDFPCDTGGETFLVQQCIPFGNGCTTAFDFTDWEEVYGLNTVSDIPTFNLQTNIGGVDQQIPFYNHGINVPSSPPPYAMTWSFSGGHNYVNIDNEPYLSWVGAPIGDGLETWQVSGSQGNTFQLDNPMGVGADPASGYDVNFYYDYCTLPCSDVSFSPTYAEVTSCQTCIDAYFDVSGTIPAGPSYYIMGVYGSYSVYWTIAQFYIYFPS